MFTHWVLYSKLGRKHESTQVAEIKLQILVWVCGIHNVQPLSLQKDKHLLVILKISFGSLKFVNMTIFLQLCLTELFVLPVDFCLSSSLNRVLIRNILYNGTHKHKGFLGFPNLIFCNWKSLPFTSYDTRVNKALPFLKKEIWEI